MRYIKRTSGSREKRVQNCDFILCIFSIEKTGYISAIHSPAVLPHTPLTHTRQDLSNETTPTSIRRLSYSHPPRQAHPSSLLGLEEPRLLGNWAIKCSQPLVQDRVWIFMPRAVPFWKEDSISFHHIPATLDGKRVVRCAMRWGDRSPSLLVIEGRVVGATPRPRTENAPHATNLVSLES